MSSTFGFSGEQRDAGTGLVHLRAREYAPGLGRFLSRDPIQPSAAGTQGWQPYAYAGNNPTTLTDPSGRVAGEFDLRVQMQVNLTLAASGASFFMFAWLVTVQGVGPSLLGMAAILAAGFLLLAVLFLMMAAVIAVQDFCATYDRCGSGGFAGFGEGIGTVVAGLGTAAVRAGATATALTCEAAGGFNQGMLGPLPARFIASSCPAPPDRDNNCFVERWSQFVVNVGGAVLENTPAGPVFDAADYVLEARKAAKCKDGEGEDKPNNCLPIDYLGGWIEIARKRAKDGTSEEEIVERAQDLKNRAHTQKSNRNFGGRAHTCYTPDGGLWHQLPNGRWDHFGWV